MKQFRKLCPIALALLMLGLSGCGSDSDDVVNLPDDGATTPDTSNPSVEERNPAWEFMEVPYFELKDSTLKGEIEVVFGRLDSSPTPWLKMGLLNAVFKGDLSADINGDGLVNRYDSTEAGLKDIETGITFTIDSSDMIKYLSTNPDGLGAGTARPDIFVEGHYSVFDLLRYLVGTRDDLRFEGPITSYKDSKYDTFEYNLSWDFNKDGLFNEDDGEHFNSPFWHFGFRHTPGTRPTEFYNYAGSGHVVYNWKRMDHFWLREEDSVRFQPHSEMMTNRRHWIWQQEQNRLKENDGKFIIPRLTKRGNNVETLLYASLKPDDVIAENVEVIPFNLRSDVYQPGQITALDVWLTLAKYHGMDFRFNWWPTVITGAKIDSFALTYAPWHGEFKRLGGVTPYQGELAARYDFSVVGSLPECNFTKEGVPTEPGKGEIDKELCWKEFLFDVAGNFLPEPIGSNLLSYPPEYMELVSHNFAPSINVKEIDLHDDPKVEVYVAKDELQHMGLNDGSLVNGFDLYPTEDVTGTASLIYFPAADEEHKVGNAPILDETHFGWKVADCTQCHNDEKQPLGHGGQSWPINEADGFDVVQPYYCASCHGSNGAPEAHNRGAGCFWCHNTHNGDGILMKNHGDASKPKFIPADRLVANHRKSFNAPLGKDGTVQKHGDMWVASPNSDYNLSKTFPDPYACGTCHGFERELDREK